MNNIGKKIIILLIIILFIISFVLIIILSNLKNEEENIVEKNRLESEFENNDNSELKVITETKIEGINDNAYFNINECMKVYLNVINMKRGLYYGQNEEGAYVITSDEKEIAETIMCVLSKKYILKNNINTDNLMNKVKVLDQSVIYVPLEASLKKSDNIAHFVIHGLLVDNDYNYKDEVFYIVNMNVEKHTFTIEPLDQKYNSIDEVNITDFDESIEDKNINSYNSESSDFLTKARNYIQLYKMISIAKPEKMYELFEKEYRNARFGSLQKYKEYVLKNKKEIMNTEAAEYLVNYGDNNIEYVVKDQYGNLYIFDEKAVLNYTVKLDTYTLEQEKFNTEYKNATNKKKVQMNIDKFFQMLNANDYNSAYKLLNENFKALNFKTEESFENFVKQNLYTHANVTYVNFSDKISGVFTYYIELKNKANASDKEIGMNIVMQLKDGTDFNLSFEIVN